MNDIWCYSLSIWKFDSSNHPNPLTFHSTVLSCKTWEPDTYTSVFINNKRADVLLSPWIEILVDAQSNMCFFMNIHLFNHFLQPHNKAGTDRTSSDGDFTYIHDTDIILIVGDTWYKSFLWFQNLCGTVRTCVYYTTDWYRYGRHAGDVRSISCTVHAFAQLIGHLLVVETVALKQYTYQFRSHIYVPMNFVVCTLQLEYRREKWERTEHMQTYVY